MVDNSFPGESESTGWIFLRPQKTLHSCTESKSEGKDLNCKVTVDRVQICLKPPIFFFCLILLLIFFCCCSSTY